MPDNKGAAFAILSLGAGLLAIGLASRQTNPPPPPGRANAFGTVTDALTGQAVPAAVITLGSIQVQANASGAYFIADIEPGSYNIAVSKANYVDFSAQVEIVEGNNQFDVDLIPIVPPDKGASLTGVVTDSGTGQPIAGVSVSVGTIQAQTNVLGAYTLKSLVEGSINVDFAKDGYQPLSRSISIVKGINNLSVSLTAAASGPQLLSISLPSTVPGGTFMPDATVFLPPAERYRVIIQVDQQIFYPQAGAVPIMDFQFAASIPDPNSAEGLILIPLDSPNGQYSLHGRAFIAEGHYTYDQNLYNAMIAAGQAAQAAYLTSQAAWANVDAVWAAIMASWPPDWEDDPNWQYTHPPYSYPEWRAAQEAAQAATDAWHAATEAHQAAIDAFQATEVRTYTRELIPAQAVVITIQSYNLPHGEYPVVCSIFQKLPDLLETEYAFGQVAILRVT